jgi:Flp pilus assembly protein TadD
MHALDRLLAIDPNDPEALETKGVSLFRSGDVEHARPLLERAAEVGPMTARAHVALAALALKAGKRDEAIAELESARRIEPRDAWIIDKLAVTYADDRLAKVQAQAQPHATAASSWLPPAWR